VCRQYKAIFGHSLVASGSAAKRLWSLKVATFWTPKLFKSTALPVASDWSLYRKYASFAYQISVANRKASTVIKNAGDIYPRLNMSDRDAIRLVLEQGYTQAGAARSLEINTNMPGR